MEYRYPALCVGVTGGSGSGKSTFTGLLAERLAPLHPAILHQDRYFRHWEEAPERRTVNHPDGMVWPEFLARFETLRLGQAVQEPAPGTRASLRGGEYVTVEPSAVLIVEGLFALWHPDVRQRLDLRLYMDVADDERVIRRFLRDARERGGDLERSAAWYRQDVRPNFPVYTESSRRYAHFVIPWDERNLAAVAAVADWVNAELARRAAAPDMNK